MKTIDYGIDQLKRIASWLIYASVVLGALLIAQLYVLNVPSSLLYSIFAGWLLYLVVALAIWMGHDRAYPAAVILAFVTLAVSLPQPEHLSFTEAGPTLASLTFIIGSVLQVGVIVLVAYSMIRARKYPRPLSREANGKNP